MVTGELREWIEAIEMPEGPATLTPSAQVMALELECDRLQKENARLRQARKLTPQGLLELARGSDEVYHLVKRIPTEFQRNGTAFRLFCKTMPSITWTFPHWLMESDEPGPWTLEEIKKAGG